jgi:hypothetical protein
MVLFYLNEQCFNCILVQNYVVLINTQDKKKSVSRHVLWHCLSSPLRELGETISDATFQTFFLSLTHTKQDQKYSFAPIWCWTWPVCHFFKFVLTSLKLCHDKQRARPEQHIITCSCNVLRGRFKRLELMAKMKAWSSTVMILLA